MSATLPEVRRARLLELVRSRGTARVSDLSDLLEVTPITVRRDIAALAEEGLLRRVHGGAAAVGAFTRESASQAVPTTPLPTWDAGRTIGMLVPSLDYYWPEVVTGAREAARKRGLRLVLRATTYGALDDRTHIEHLVDATQAQGLLLAPNMSSPAVDALLASLAERRIPVVLVEREGVGTTQREAVDCVLTDHITGAGAAVRHLAGLGHAKVGLVVSHSPHASRVREGWEAASRQCGLNPTETIDRVLDRRQGSGSDVIVEEIVDECLRTGTTGLLVHADPEAIALVQGFERRGVRVPDDVSIMAYDDEVAALYSPALSAVRPPRISVGRAAVELLANRLDDPPRPAHRVVINPRLNIRASCGAPPVRAQESVR